MVATVKTRVIDLQLPSSVPKTLQSIVSEVKTENQEEEEEVKPKWVPFGFSNQEEEIKSEVNNEEEINDELIDTNENIPELPLTRTEPEIKQEKEEILDSETKFEEKISVLTDETTKSKKNKFVAFKKRKIDSVQQNMRGRLNEDD